MKYEAVGDWIFGKPLDIFEQNGVLVINEENSVYKKERCGICPLSLVCDIPLSHTQFVSPCVIKALMLLGPGRVNTPAT